MGSSLATSQPLKEIIDVTSLPFPLSLNVPFLVRLTAPTVLSFFFFLILPSLVAKSYYEADDVTQTGLTSWWCQ